MEEYRSITWSVNFEIIKDGETVEFWDLTEDEQEEILDSIKRDFYFGMFDN
jgi:hypothetical protein